MAATVSKLVAGMASSHAMAFVDPSTWDGWRAQTRERYTRRQGAAPPEHPNITAESDDDLARRQPRISEALAFLRQKLTALRPDALILIGDDQNEHFTEANLPQVAIYLGEGFTANEALVASIDGDKNPGRHRGEPALAATILETCVESEIDMASLRSFPDDRLRAHAFGPVLRVLDPEGRIPVVPIFVNAVHPPSPSPARCHYIGEIIRRAVERHPAATRVVMYASGGLSHFTASYPWKHYHGSLPFGGISEAFDRELLAHMEAGDGRALTRLTSQDLLDNGDVEFRSWLILLGAMGDTRPELLVYEPFYRATMGLGVGAWDLTPA